MRRRGWIWGTGIIIAGVLLFGLTQISLNQAFEAKERKVLQDLADLKDSEGVYRSPFETWEPFREAVARLKGASTWREVRDLFAGSASLSQIQEDLKRRESGRPFPYESSRPLAWPPWPPDHSDVFRREGPSTLRSLLLEVVLAEDVWREGGLRRAERRVAWEEYFLTHWHRLSLDRNFQPEELAEAADLLDRLEASRPDLAQTLRREHLLERLVVVRALREKDTVGYLGRPGWKSLFTWRRHAVLALEDLERAYSEISELARMPLARRVPALNAWSPNQDKPVWERPLFDHAPEFLRVDARLAPGRILRRAAVAVAWYRAERGALPERLADLVPRYIAAEPKCPLTGEPLKYERGAITAGNETWRVAE